VWSQANGIVDLGVLPGGSFSYAIGINDRGDIVGCSESVGGQHNGVLWSGGQMINLNTVVPPGSSRIEDARAINNAGMIVGWGNGRALLLIPDSNRGGHFDTGS
jgi:probable HAF family extracellular repeat protein